LSEGLAMGKRYGLDPEAMVDVLNVSTGMSWVAQTHIKQRVLSRRFDDPFKLALMVKDIGIAMALARSTGTPAPLSEQAARMWRAAAAAASPEASVSELVGWVERATGSEISAGASARVVA
jgi:3-hydroxyisobutyrate dehydrogenase-like beta-hydroxyacid dehydrogenase